MLSSKIDRLGFRDPREDEGTFSNVPTMYPLKGSLGIVVSGAGV